MATPLDVQIAYSETMEELTATSRKFEELIRKNSMRQLVDFNKGLIGSGTAFNSLAGKLTEVRKTLDKFNSAVNASNTAATMLYMGQALSSAGRSLIDLRDKIYNLQNQLGTTFATAVDSGTAAFTNQITSLFTAGPALSFRDSINAINAFQQEFGTLLTRGAAADIAKGAKQFGTDVGIFVRAQRAFLVGPNSLANQAKLQQQFITQFRAAGLTANQALTFAANNANLVAIAGVKYADALARAAANATKIGVSLEKTEAFADTLVGDFEGGLERISELRAMGVEVDFNELARVAGTGTPEEVFNELSRQLGGNSALLEQVQRNRFLKVAIERDLGLSIADVKRLAAGPAGLPGEETKPEENQGGFLAGLTKVIGPFAKVGGILATAMGLQTTATMANTMAIMKNTTGSIAQALGLKAGGGGLTGLGTAAKGIGIAGGIAGVGMSSYGAYQAQKAGDRGGALANVLMSTLSGAGTGAMIGGGLPGALIGGLVGLGSGLLSMAAASDISMGPGAGRVILGPEGAFKLNPKDSILAGTNLFQQANDMAYVNPASPPVEKLTQSKTMTASEATTTNVNVDMSKLENKLDKLASAFSAIKIEMDGNTVGRVSLNARSPLDRLSVVG